MIDTAHSGAPDPADGSLRCPLVTVYSKDLNTGKMIVAEIFRSFKTDKDLKLTYDELREQVYHDLSFLESDLRGGRETREQYHNYRTDKAIETRINVGSEDLVWSLWMLDLQMVAEYHSFLLQMASDYFKLVEIVQTTNELLQEPGIIGRRKSVIKRSRRQIYG